MGGWIGGGPAELPNRVLATSMNLSGEIFRSRAATPEIADLSCVVSASGAGTGASVSFFPLVGRVGLEGISGSYFSTKFLGKRPSCFFPVGSINVPVYQSLSSSSITVMT